MSSFSALIETFKKNSQGFWRGYRWFVLVFLISIAADAVSTIYFMRRIGPEAEKHPAIYFVSIVLGPVIGPLFGAVAKAVAGIVVGIYCRRLAPYIFVLASLLSLWAAWYNFTQIW